MTNLNFTTCICTPKPKLHHHKRYVLCWYFLDASERAMCRGETVSLQGSNQNDARTIATVSTWTVRALPARFQSCVWSIIWNSWRRDNLEVHIDDCSIRFDAHMCRDTSYSNSSNLHYKYWQRKSPCDTATHSMISLKRVWFIYSHLCAHGNADAHVCT